MPGQHVFVSCFCCIALDTTVSINKSKQVLIYYERSDSLNYVRWSSEVVENRRRRTSFGVIFRLSVQHFMLTIQQDKGWLFNVATKMCKSEQNFWQYDLKLSIHPTVTKSLVNTQFTHEIFPLILYTNLYVVITSIQREASIRKRWTEESKES